jgi:transcription antitermination factor NusG
MFTPWYVLRSKPQKEEFLYSQLSARGFDVFYPRLCVKPVNPRCRTVRPYFPGYLFVSVNLQTEGFLAFHWLPGSLGLVCFGDEPATVPVELINTIQRSVDHANAGFGIQHDFKSGDLVVVREGIFDGYEAIFDTHMPSNDRVRVLLQYLKGRQVPLVLPVQQIESVQGSY